MTCVPCRRGVPRPFPVKPARGEGGQGAGWGPGPGSPQPRGSPPHPRSLSQPFQCAIRGQRNEGAMLEGTVDFQVSVAGLFCLGKLDARSSFLATLMG